MRNVTVKMPHGEGEWIIISNTAELMEYFEFVSGKVVDQTTRLIKSKAPSERWDHMITQSHEGSILAAAVLDCKINGGSPILKMDSHLQNKFLTMLDYVVEGKELLVNRMGGFCWMVPEYQILNTSIVDTGFKPTYIINDNTKYINLENDPDLEARTKEFLGAIDPNFSYVLNLHKHSEEELVKIFNDFKSKGGQFVHVYTTGMNVPQMYEYFSAAIKAEIDNFVFEFNSGISDGIQSFIEHAKKHANVEVLNEKN